MRLPRLTTRRLMMVMVVMGVVFTTAIVALVGYSRRVQQHRQALAVPVRDRRPGGPAHGGVDRLDHDGEALRTLAPETPARTAAEVEGRRRRRSAYRVALKAKYERV